MPELRKPPPEVQAARSPRLRRIGHSVGFVVATGDLPVTSFRVEGAEVVAEGGWGFSGPVPAVHVNPPADLRAVHTVAVTAIDDRVFAGLRQLAEEHLTRYGECSVWWAADPSPAPEVEGRPGTGLPSGFVNR